MGSAKGIPQSMQFTKFTYDTLQALDSGHDNLSVFLDLTNYYVQNYSIMEYAVLLWSGSGAICQRENNTFLIKASTPNHIQ